MGHRFDLGGSKQYMFASDVTIDAEEVGSTVISYYTHVLVLLEDAAPLLIGYKKS